MVKSSFAAMWTECGCAHAHVDETATQPSPVTGQRRDFGKKVVDLSGGQSLEANGQVPLVFYAELYDN